MGWTELSFAVNFQSFHVATRHTMSLNPLIAVNYVFIIFLQIIICKNDRYADIAFSSTS